MLNNVPRNLWSVVTFGLFHFQEIDRLAAVIYGVGYNDE